jgi:hypothetical protein
MTSHNQKDKEKKSNDFFTFLGGAHHRRSGGAGRGKCLKNAGA